MIFLNFCSSTLESGLFVDLKSRSLAFLGISENYCYTSDFEEIKKRIFDNRLFYVSMQNAGSVIVTWIGSIAILGLLIIIIEFVCKWNEIKLKSSINQKDALLFKPLISQIVR